MALIGYARVSTIDQDPDSQERLLAEAGCERIFVDRGESSRKRHRPEWDKLMEYVRPGDTIIVRELSRLAGTERILIDTINELGEKGLNVRSLTEPDFDTTTPMGRAIFGIFAVMAQLRVDMIRELTRIGMANARSRGKRLGRPNKLTPDQVKSARLMYAQKENVATIARVLGVSRATVTRAIDSETPQLTGASSRG